MEYAPIHIHERPKSFMRKLFLQKMFWRAQRYLSLPVDGSVKGLRLGCTVCHISLDDCLVFSFGTCFIQCVVTDQNTTRMPQSFMEASFDRRFWQSCNFELEFIFCVENYVLIFVWNILWWPLLVIVGVNYLKINGCVLFSSLHIALDRVPQLSKGNAILRWY